MKENEVWFDVKMVFVFPLWKRFKTSFVLNDNFAFFQMCVLPLTRKTNVFSRGKETSFATHLCVIGAAKTISTCNVTSEVMK